MEYSIIIMMTSSICIIEYGDTETLHHHNYIYSNITSSQLYIVTLHHHSYIIYFSEHLNAVPVVVSLVAEVLYVYYGSDLMYFASFL